MLDILIKGGMVVDGSGTSAAFKADVGISNGRIAAVGELGKENAHSLIDAKNHIISPGFIDIQNHSDSYGALLRTPTLQSMLAQGITTLLVGHAGSSLAPLLKGSLASIQKWTDITGVNVDWRSMAEFLEVVDVRGSGPNIATLVGHATLRRDLVGDAERPLDEKEEVQLNTLLKRSLTEGAWGLSAGLEYAHERTADPEELSRALETVSRSRGVASFHLRDEGKGFSTSLAEIIELAKKSGVRGKISRFKIEHEDKPAAAGSALETLDKARASGIDLYIDVYPYTVSASTLYLLLPHWATDGGRSSLMKKLKDATVREEIAQEMRTFNYPYHDIRIASSKLDRTLMGKSIASLAQNQSTTPEDVIFNALVASEDQMIVFFKNTSEELFNVFVKWPYAMIATNGVGYSAKEGQEVRELPHPRSFGTTARILGHYVREKKLLSLEEAVHKMSGLPASFLGIKDRGLIVKGNFADLVVYNPDTVDDRATYEKPFVSPAGIPHVFVNGVPVIEHGAYNGKTPGIVLYK